MKAKYSKTDFLKRFSILEKEVNKLPALKRARVEPNKAQLKRFFRAKKLLTIMQNRYPVIAIKINQNVSACVITDNFKYSLD